LTWARVSGGRAASSSNLILGIKILLVLECNHSFSEKLVARLYFGWGC
jgi:hypothetical protein